MTIEASASWTTGQVRLSPPCSLTHLCLWEEGVGQTQVLSPGARIRGSEHL